MHSYLVDGGAEHGGTTFFFHGDLKGELVIRRPDGSVEQDAESFFQFISLNFLNSTERPAVIAFDGKTNDGNAGKLLIPTQHLLQFFALEYLVQNKIAKLEQMEVDEVLAEFTARQRGGIRYKFADDLLAFLLHSNEDFTARARQIELKRYGFHQQVEPCFVNILGAHKLDELRSRKKVEFILNGEKITGWVSADMLALHIDSHEDALFDGRFNGSLE